MFVVEIPETGKKFTLIWWYYLWRVC